MPALTTRPVESALAKSAKVAGMVVLCGRPSSVSKVAAKVGVETSVSGRMIEVWEVRMF
jgi:hypothetical protein